MTKRHDYVGFSMKLQPIHRETLWDGVEDCTWVILNDNCSRQSLHLIYDALNHIVEDLITEKVVGVI